MGNFELFHFTFDCLWKKKTKTTMMIKNVWKCNEWSWGTKSKITFTGINWPKSRQLTIKKELNLESMAKKAIENWGNSEGWRWLPFHPSKRPEWHSLHNNTTVTKQFLNSGNLMWRAAARKKIVSCKKKDCFMFMSSAVNVCQFVRSTHGSLVQLCTSSMSVRFLALR